MALGIDLQRSRPCDEAPRSHRPVVFKFPRDGQVLDDWFVRATAIASRWLPLSRPVIHAEITCLAHPSTSGMNASCIACVGIAKHLARVGQEADGLRTSRARRLAHRENQAEQHTGTKGEFRENKRRE